MSDIVALAIVDTPGGPGADWPFPAVVLVHGWCCDATDWDEFVAHIARHARVVTVELRGHGHSPDGASWDLASMAADVAAVLDRLDIAGAMLVGHSAGAEVVGQIAADRPDLAARLVAIDPAFGVAERDRARAELASERMVTSDPREVVAEYFAALIEPAELAARHRRLALRARPRAARGMFDAVNLGPDSWHFAREASRFLARVQQPLLTIYRNADRAEAGRRLRQNPADRVLEYGGTGHWPHQQHPDRFLADLDEWARAAHGS
ncbi:alpha/beta fold hydrolase [uncultured Microbacterium sp.]|uniref:alpha/beta fold hydrolase n=1 Tax=uncultured Microbacterium sp. TaxID=191216 RepID=UPI0035CBCC7F